MQIKSILVKFEKLIDQVKDLRKKEFSRNELKRLLFLMESKFKNYEQFPIGLNFLENFYLWLKNFENEEDRNIAIDLFWRIIFFSRDEMKYLTELLFREQIKKYLLLKIIKEKNLKNYDFKNAYNDHWEEYFEKSLFIALSDGAMIDFFRRANSISNDQIVPYYKLHPEEQEKEYTKETKRFFFLIEDFIGTGTTLFRDECKENSEYWLDENNLESISVINLPKNDYLLAGALLRFIKYWDLKKINDYEIIICPYIITEFAIKRLEKMITYYGKNGRIPNYENIIIIPAYIIPNESRVIMSVSKKKIRNWEDHICDFEGIEKLCLKYYHTFIPDDHLLKGGDCRFGFGNRGIAVVRYNNTPNNSIYLLWHNDNNWNPVFMRNERHKEKVKKN